MRRKLEVVGLVVVSVVLTLAMVPSTSWMTLVLSDQDRAGMFQSPVSPVATPLPGPVYEAEDCTLYGRFVAEESLTANGGLFVHVPDGMGDQGPMPDDEQRASCLVAVAEAGEYYVRARVAAPDERGDSFFVRVDGWPEPGALWDLSALNLNWTYDLVGDRDGFDPLVFDLAAGAHRVEFYLREDGSRLDSFELIDAGTWPPPTYGPVPTDTPTPTDTPRPMPTGVGEWYDTCPDCDSTPQPTYTPNPTPTCLPCVSPTPYPTSTPYPPQPTFAPL